jgi:peptide-methionine (S)-S-oxide reductase
MKAAFAAGCFWGVEARFKELGVNTTVGYMGGGLENPTYEQVSTGETGHAETVLIEYDPKKVSYEDLLKLFWSMHDYTQLNRQGLDRGSNYRSAIFYFNEKQKHSAEASKPKDAVTEIVRAKRFWPAEDYHQNYYEKHGKVC